MSTFHPAIIVPIIAVGDEEVARRVQGDTMGRVQAGLSRRPSIAAEGSFPILFIVFITVNRPASRNGGDDPGLSIDAADTVIVGICDEKVSCAIESHVPGLTDLGVAGYAAIAGQAPFVKPAATRCTVPSVSSK